MKKEDIRMRMRARKTLLSDSERSSAAAEVFATLEKMAAFMMADTVLMLSLIHISEPTRPY